MKAQIKCAICEEVLATIEKDLITNEDMNLYKQTAFCDEHGQENIVVELVQAN
jgi:hypothetical protein